MIQASIEMIAQIGETVVQDIPVINYSNKDWTIKCQLMNDNVRGAHF